MTNAIGILGWMGILILILGIVVSIVAKVCTETLVFESKTLKKIEIGETDRDIARFYMRQDGLLRVRFKEKDGRRAIFFLTKKVVVPLLQGRMIDYIRYDEKKCGDEGITFEIKAEGEYTLKAKSEISEGLSGDVEYKYMKVEKPLDWLFSVGLTMTTIGVVLFVAGLAC